MTHSTELPSGWLCADSAAPSLPTGSLGWQEMRGPDVAHCALWDLAKAVVLLHSDREAKDWTTDTILAVLEELTGRLFVFSF